MSKEEVGEVIDDLKGSIESEINSALSDKGS